MDKIEQFVRKLAEFSVTKTHDELPSFYNLAFMNWFGVTLAGANQVSVDRTARYYQEEAPGEYTPIGRGEHLSASACALIDCFSSETLGYDDIHFGTTLHPAGPVAAAILAVAHKTKINGKEAMRALRIGMEVEIRMTIALLGKGTNAAKGWYPTAIAGGFGAAAAAGYLLSLSEDEMMTAFAITAQRSTGTRGAHGANSAFLPPAYVTEAGYAAVRMAQIGFTCNGVSVYGKNGFINQITSSANIDEAIDGLGERYYTEDTSCKPFPYGFIGHAVISCCNDLWAYMHETGKKLKELDVYVSDNNANLGDNPAPKNMNQAQVSIRYIAAAVMVDPGLAYTPVEEDFKMRSDIEEMTRYITVKGAEGINNQQARCTALFEDGTEKEVRCDFCPGSVENMLSEKDTRDKFMRLVSPIRGTDGAKELMTQYDHLQDIDDISAFIK